MAGTGERVHLRGIISPRLVMPAEAGTQLHFQTTRPDESWAPAFAGVTVVVGGLTQGIRTVVPVVLRDSRSLWAWTASAKA